MTERLDAHEAPGPLEPQLAKLVEDTRLVDAGARETTFGPVASKRVLDKVRLALESPGAPEAVVAASRLSSLRVVALLASVCVLGIVAGSQLHLDGERPPSRPPAPSPLEPRAAEPSAAVPAASAPEPADEIPMMRIDDLPSSVLRPAPPPPGSVRRAPPGQDPPPAGDLAEEYRLIERARAGIESKDPAGALRSVHEYEERFPKGQLNQECESLHIQALVLAGRIDEARERAATFQARFPNGLLLPSVARAIASAPANSTKP
ncbi:MAG: hypothetical protein K0S65_1007 [Labilithrix sp.]|nr:hypothetical protein [Labilithrix sp.]